MLRKIVGAVFFIAALAVMIFANKIGLSRDVALLLVSGCIFLGITVPWGMRLRSNRKARRTQDALYGQVPRRRGEGPRDHRNM